MKQPTWLITLEAVAALATIAWVTYNLWPRTIAVTQAEYSLTEHMCGDTRCY